MRMPRFNSLRANIIVVVVLASGLAVTLFTVMMIYVNTSSSIARLDNRLATLADVIGQNSTAALDFSDRKAAAEVLGALRREASVVSACLYDTHGLLFSEYLRDDEAESCPRHGGTAKGGGGEYQSVTPSLRRAGDVVGASRLAADS